MQNNTIHAFVPTICAYDLERQIRVGSINIITGFIVQDYKKTDKFRVVRRDNQLIFTTDTKIQQIEETAAQIATEIFDFYDLSELKNYMTETTYVIGKKALDLKYYRPTY